MKTSSGSQTQGLGRSIKARIRAFLGHRSVRDEVKVVVARAPRVPGHVTAGFMVQHVRNGHQRNPAACLPACQANQVAPGQLPLGVHLLWFFMWACPALQRKAYCV